MSETLSEVEENTFRVLLSTMRKHDPDALQRIIFDVLFAGMADADVLVVVKGEEDDHTDDPTVEAAVIAIRGSENVAKFFRVLEASQLDESEDTGLS